MRIRPLRIRTRQTLRQRISNNRILTALVALSVIWTAAFLLIWGIPLGGDPNEAGDTLAGFAAPLAVAWFVGGFLLQGIELREQREVLQEQMQAIRDQAMQARRQLDEQKRERELVQQQLQPAFAISDVQSAGDNEVTVTVSNQPARFLRVAKVDPALGLINQPSAPGTELHLYPATYPGGATGGPGSAVAEIEARRRSQFTFSFMHRGRGWIMFEYIDVQGMARAFYIHVGRDGPRSVVTDYPFDAYEAMESGRDPKPEWIRAAKLPSQLEAHSQPEGETDSTS